MSVINDTWRFLVQRRLWPVAILLVAAAVAVPMLLAEEPAPPATAPVVAVKGDKSAVLATEPIVAPAADGDRSGRRQVLGSRKDPFKPAGHADPDADAEGRRAAADAPPTPARADRQGWRRDVRRRARPRRTPAPRSSRRPRSKKTYELNELTVRFGAERDTARRRASDVKRLQALPSSRRARADLPRRAQGQEDRGVPARLGRRRPGRRRVPPVPHHLRDHPHQGGRDGVLRRRPPRMAMVTEEASGAQYQLDVVKIRKTTTTTRQEGQGRQGARVVQVRPARSCAPGSPATGRCATATTSAPAGWRSSAKKAYKAVVAKAAKTARAALLGLRPSGRRAQSPAPPKLCGRAAAPDHRRGVAWPRPHLHRRGAARRASSSTWRRSTPTWRAASSATAAAGA